MVAQPVRWFDDEKAGSRRTSNQTRRERFLLLAPMRSSDRTEERPSLGANRKASTRAECVTFWTRNGHAGSSCDIA
jgi:hypothetical protein